MSRRNKIIAAVLVIAALFVAAILLYLYLPQQGAAPASQPAVNSATPPATGLPTAPAPAAPVAANVNAAIPAPAPAPAPTDDRSNLRRVAAAFAERFGSFSNQSDFQNIIDLKPFMTAKMQAWADGYITEQRAAASSASYTGITTRALTTTASAFDDKAGTAVIRVRTQREETSASAKKVYYQDLVLEFLKENGIWKVDVATWQTPG